MTPPSVPRRSSAAASRIKGANRTVRYQYVPAKGGWHDRYILVNRNDGNLGLLLTPPKPADPDAPDHGCCPAVFDSPAAARGFVQDIKKIMDAETASGRKSPFTICIEPSDAAVARATAKDFMEEDVVYIVRPSRT